MKKNLLSFVFSLFVGILFLFSTSVSAQIRKDFTQRTSQYSPSTKMYYLKGNYAMIGNTNMKGTATNNNGQMNYVDVDNVSRTINSSSAVLTFPMDYDANPACSEVVYAGLYWSGRSDTSAYGLETWHTGVYRQWTQNKQWDGYKFTYWATGTYDANITYFSFAPTSGSGDTVVIAFAGTKTSDNILITAQVGSNPPVEIPATVVETTNQWGRRDQRAFFNSEYEISTGSNILYVTQLFKRTDTSTGNSNWAIATTKNSTTVVLSKHQVLFKYGDATEDTYPYQTVTASSNDIYYPVDEGEDKYIFVAYAEVTDYVKEHGLGNYFVGNIS